MKRISTNSMTTPKYDWWWEENIRADQWEKKFQDARAREDALERDLLESQNEKVRLRARVAELERSCINIVVATL
ncbi:hypothetical protein Gohar_019125 [Gossypium harknessii]|uniref:Uncharacterized protein n=1 Tax=Gossypium harknessii TaxID=34285 RepID=A0A7J9GB81_9ROSI|nr:hypothetical protein [Gossypium harknessii]